MANDGTVKIGVEVDEKEFASNISKLSKKDLAVLLSLEIKVDGVMSTLQDAMNRPEFKKFIKAINAGK